MRLSRMWFYGFWGFLLCGEIDGQPEPPSRAVCSVVPGAVSGLVAAISGSKERMEEEKDRAGVCACVCVCLPPPCWPSKMPHCVSNVPSAAIAGRKIKINTGRRSVGARPTAIYWVSRKLTKRWHRLPSERTCASLEGETRFKHSDWPLFQIRCWKNGNVSEISHRRREKEQVWNQCVNKNLALCPGG